MSTRGLFEDVLLFTAMVAMACADVGLKTLYKAATSKGLSYYVFIVYSHAIAALLLLPFPFLSHRSDVLPPLNISISCKLALLGAIASASQIMGYTGINYTSPTLSSAMSNLIPGFTFIFSVIFGMEKLALKRPSSAAKLAGTIVSIAGAFVVTLYKGSPITKTTLSLQLDSLSSNWAIGGAFLAAESILVSLCFILQKHIMNEYPPELTIIFYFNLSISVMVTIFAVITQTDDGNAWRVKPDISLASIICSGVIRSCVYNLVHTWALRLKGPVFVAMFNPFSIAIAVGMGVLFLQDSLYLGSLMGAIIIVAGFYGVMWGKAKEEKEEMNKMWEEDAESSMTTHHHHHHNNNNAPLLG